jgi:limonene-1,2-epoxide hydrolase
MSVKKNNVELSEEFFARWETNYEDMCQAYYDFFADDCVWENVGFATTHGPKQAVEEGLAPSRVQGMETVPVDILRIGEVAGAVWSERVDHMDLRDGTRAFSVPVAGIMVFNDEGKITEWRDFFNGTPMIEFMKGDPWLDKPAEGPAK